MLPKNIGKIDHYVNDFSGVLEKSSRISFDEKFKNLSGIEGLQAVTVLFPHREGLELRDIGIELFNSVGIGEKGKNNGLLLLISTDEKKIRIVVGKGLEWIFSNNWCRDIIEGKLRGLLNSGDYESLIKTWYEVINKRQILPPVKQNINIIKQIQIVLKFLSAIFLVPGIIFYTVLISTTSFLQFLLFLGPVIIFLLFIFRKSSKWLKIFIVFLFFILVGISYQNELNKKYCEKNPIICEQKELERKLELEKGQIEREKKFCESRPLSCVNGKIDYNSVDYQKYKIEKNESSVRSDSSNKNSSSSSRSSSSSSSSFDGGGGSTNGAGWGD